MLTFMVILDYHYALSSRSVLLSKSEKVFLGWGLHLGWGNRILFKDLYCLFSSFFESEIPLSPQSRLTKGRLEYILQ